MHQSRSQRLSLTLFVVAISFFSIAAQDLKPERPKWFKGNTHSHTLNSDGDSTPEEVVSWYKTNGYNFLFITDHETLTPVDGLNTAFAQPNEFSVFAGQEVTDRLSGKPYHVNGLGISKVTMPNGGKTVVENLQLNIDGVRSAGGLAQVNHPNFGWALTAEQIAKLNNVWLMEIYNAHPLVNNQGGGGSPSVEAIWDAILSTGKLIYGVASDDVHTVRKLGDRKQPTPGHGWIMVRANELSQKAILDALKNGNFYSSTGVELENYSTDLRTVLIKVKAERSSRYSIQFIGRNGQILQETNGLEASYSVKGNEGYIRVKVLESNGKFAWVQPGMLSSK